MAEGRGIPRRECLRLGLLGGLGLTMPELFSLRAAADVPRRQRPGKARSCILLFMYGGPAHQDIWDMKPDGPTEVRGEFKPISTCVPGIQICEHLPHLSKQAHRYAIVRSLTHADSVHETAFYTMATGRARDAAVSSVPLPGDHPHMGSIVSLLSQSDSPLSPFVTTRQTLENGGGEQHYPGLGTGFLDKAYEPVVLQSDQLHRPGFEFAGLALPPDVSPERFDQRRRLLATANQQTSLDDQSAESGDHRNHRERAVSLLTSSAAQRAIDLSHEPASVRQRYGMSLYGQHLLLARRLVEAGVSLITVYYNLMIPRLPINNQPLWDTHKSNFMYLKDHLLPSVDEPISVLLDDLDERGLLDETLVVWSSEFGRTSGLNEFGGRDHWPGANSVVLAGGGIQGGQVYGVTDERAGYPVQDPVTPGQLAATIFHALGIDPATQIHDKLQRPHHIADGAPILDLFGG